jgi:hypothetical protein
VLNDDVLIDNIETNILKNIAENEARPEGLHKPSLPLADMVSYNITSKRDPLVRKKDMQNILKLFLLKW